MEAILTLVGLYLFLRWLTTPPREEPLPRASEEELDDWARRLIDLSDGDDVRTIDPDLPAAAQIGAEMGRREVDAEDLGRWIDHHRTRHWLDSMKAEYRQLRRRAARRRAGVVPGPPEIPDLTDEAVPDDEGAR